MNVTQHIIHQVDLVKCHLTCQQTKTNIKLIYQSSIFRMNEVILMENGRHLQVLASQMDFLIVLEQHVLVLVDGEGSRTLSN